MSRPQAWTGRFAPSPTGPLHAGSLVAALASWLDARAHGGRWLLRIEDVDTPRCVPGADRTILAQLQACGLVPDEPPTWQSQRQAAYAKALARLQEAAQVYPCDCSRKAIAAHWEARGRLKARHAEGVYPGTCRHRPADALTGQAQAWRLRVDTPQAPAEILWWDRRLGAQRQHLGEAVGDFVLQRADGVWAYQLAVVVDDAQQGVSAVVRGEDLADNTPRQILLQRLLGLPTPSYLHTPLVLADDGEKLSKQNGARALDPEQPWPALQEAGRVLGLAEPAGAGSTAGSISNWLANAVRQWPSVLARWQAEAGPAPKADSIAASESLTRPKDPP